MTPEQLLFIERLKATPGSMDCVGNVVQWIDLAHVSYLARMEQIEEDRKRINEYIIKIRMGKD